MLFTHGADEHFDLIPLKTEHCGNDLLKMNRSNLRAAKLIAAIKESRNNVKDFASESHSSRFASFFYFFRVARTVKRKLLDRVA
jgi:hypothetical protein